MILLVALWSREEICIRNKIKALISICNLFLHEAQHELNNIKNTILEIPENKFHF